VPETAEAGRHYKALLDDPERLRARVVATFEAVRDLPQVDGGRIGGFGYCFGGQCLMELARSGADAKALVSFHGTLPTHRPAEPGVVKAKLLIITGARDPVAPLSDVPAFQAEMDAAGADWHLTVYSQGMHAFTDAEVAKIDYPGLSYDPLLDRLSWAQGVAFLDALLRP
jgi:dienelactone hydrolase